MLLKHAVKARASDIHIVPTKNESVIYFRMDDGLVKITSIANDICHRLISHYKFLASMDIGEKRKPQNGSLQLPMLGNVASFRLSTLPTMYAESLVIRILPVDETVSLRQLFLFPAIVSKIYSLMNHRHGLLIITGPTGSGKSTTLYSMLHEFNKSYRRNIITLEDPIEKPSDGVLQVQINEKAGITYATGLKAILRHDPDIIMVGEIRDKETAKAAIQASYTGHFVLSTLHTGDAKGALYRLQELGISVKELEQSLLGVIAQRLVPLTCPYCKGACSPLCLQMKKRRRACLAEILDGANLAAAIRECKGETVEYRYQTLDRYWRKGIALGYISSFAQGDCSVE